MNPIGVNAWVWAAPVTDAAVAEIAPKVRRMGFDVLELGAEGPGSWDPGRTAEVLAANGLGSTVCAAMGPDKDLTDPALVAGTQAFLRDAIDRAATIGATAVAGPLYTPVGKTWRSSAAERKATVARLLEGLRPLVDYAGERGVALAIEPLNRFETSFLNTAEQTMEIVEAIDSPACGVLLDTFHMNIEERSQPAAIRLVGKRLAHFHACGCDRGAPGQDAIDWPGIVAALREVGYAGPLVIESFTPDNDVIAKAAAIWRPLAPSEDALAEDGLRFLKGALA